MQLGGNGFACPFSIDSEAIVYSGDATDAIDKGEATTVARDSSEVAVEHRFLLIDLPSHFSKS
jgi:hypothetical protein